MRGQTWIPIKSGAEEGAQTIKKVKQSGLVELREAALDAEQRAHTVVTLEAGGVWKGVFKQAKRSFDMLTAPSAAVSSDEGAPEIPQEGIFVAVPDDAKDVQVKVVRKTLHALPGKWALRPAPNPVTETEYLEGKQHFVPDADIYASDKAFPGRFADFVGLKQIEGVTVAHIIAYLAQYKPASKSLSAVKSLTLDVSYTVPPRTDRSAAGPRHHMPMVGDLILDVEHAVDGHNGKAPEGEDAGVGRAAPVRPVAEALDLPQLKRTDIVCNYVIIVPNALKASVTPLYQAKCGWPYYAMVATTETIAAEFPAAGLKESVKDFLTYASTQWRSPVVYVVLAGDVDAIPAPILAAGGSSYAADHFYANLSGSLAPELIVARIPTSNAAVMQQVCQHLANYPDLRGPDWNGWVNEVLLVAYDDAVYKTCSDEIATMIGPRYTATKKYAGASTKQQVKDEINQGILFANYRGHGSKTAWSSGNGLTTGDVPGLADDRMPPMVINVACQNAWFDDQGTECLAESFLRNRKSVAVIGATRNSPTMANNDLDKYFFKSIMDYGEVEAGRIFYRAKWLMVLNHPGSASHEQDVVMYELFGDPTAMVASSANFLLGDWDMDHDGWKGVLRVTRVWPHKVEMIGGVGYPVWTFDGEYVGSDGKHFPMTGKIGGKDPNELNPGAKRVDRRVEFKITFATNNVQAFQGYVAGWTRDAMAGLTYWSNHPYEWNAKKK